MIDSHKIDDYFYGNSPLTEHHDASDSLDHRSRLIRRIKLILPSLAAVLLGLLIFIPHLEQAKDAVHIDITLPQKGELEKLNANGSVATISIISARLLNELTALKK